MQPILDRLDSLAAGDPVTFQNLSVTPLLGPGADDPDYLTLDEALARGHLRVTEVSQAGSVPQLSLQNDGGLAVLLLDGEELVGAKQNRVLNLTILAPGESTINIPVSCVEAGRWSHLSPEFRSGGRTFYAAGRAAKASHVTDSLRTTGTRQSRQGEVWQDIAEKSARLGSRSETAAMACMYEDHHAQVDDYVRAVPPADGQVGALFSINGEICGLEVFDFAATLRKLFPKLVGSYALDAIDRGGVEAPAALSQTDFLNDVRSARVSEHPSVGEGWDIRLTGEQLSGGALYARERIVHLSAFRLADHKSDTVGGFARLSRASTRGRLTRRH